MVCRWRAGEARETHQTAPPAPSLLHYSYKYRKARYNVPDGTFVSQARPPERHIRHICPTWPACGAGRVWLRRRTDRGAGSALATRFECGILAAVLAVVALLLALTPPAHPIRTGAAQRPPAGRVSR
jgi:hypothetical protein